MAASTSRQNVPAPVRPGAGPWVGLAPDGSVIAAPYLVPAGPFPAPGGPVTAPGGPYAAPTGLASTGARPDAAGPLHRRAGMVVFAAAALIGVVAVVAPFLELWRYHFTDGLIQARTVVNGWGSVSATPASFAYGNSHDTDYGLLMVLAAAFLVAGAASYAITRRAVVAGLPTSIGASLAAGTALLLALDRAGRDSATSGNDSWGVGPGFWLIMAAGALAVVVTVAAAILAAVELRANAGPPAAFTVAPGYEPTRASWSQITDPARYEPTDPAEFAPPWAAEGPPR